MQNNERLIGFGLQLLEKMSFNSSSSYSSSSTLCLNETQLKMHGTEAEKYVQRYVYSIIFLIGVTGNVLNLTVLLRRNMITR